MTTAVTTRPHMRLRTGEQNIPLRLIAAASHQRPEQSGVAWHRESGGRRIVVMDADLQHPPEKIPDLRAALDGGAIRPGLRIHPRRQHRPAMGHLPQDQINRRNVLARPFAGRVTSDVPASSRSTGPPSIVSSVTPLDTKSPSSSLQVPRAESSRNADPFRRAPPAGQSKLSLKSSFAISNISAGSTISVTRGFAMTNSAIGDRRGVSVGLALFLPLFRFRMAGALAMTLGILRRDPHHRDFSRPLRPHAKRDSSSPSSLARSLPPVRSPSLAGGHRSGLHQRLQDSIARPNRAVPFPVRRSAFLCATFFAKNFCSYPRAEKDVRKENEISSNRNVECRMLIVDCWIIANFANCFNINILQQSTFGAANPPAAVIPSPVKALEPSQRRDDRLDVHVAILRWRHCTFRCVSATAVPGDVDAGHIGFHRPLIETRHCSRSFRRVRSPRA